MYYQNSNYMIQNSNYMIYDPFLTVSTDLREMHIKKSGIAHKNRIMTHNKKILRKVY